MARSKATVLAAKSDYISPVGCDSVISYKVIKRRALWGEVSLSDCTHNISWWFDNDDRAIPKIDKAIAMLTEFKAEFIKARKRK